MTHILALIDGSSYTHSVCDHSAWLWKQYGGDLELLHVLSATRMAGISSDLTGAIGLGARSSLLEDLTKQDAANARLAKERGRAILDAAQLRLEEQGVEEISLALRHGELTETLLKRAADVLVMGKRGERATSQKQPLGSNLERVIRSLDRPVLVASRAFAPIHHLLLAYDDGVSSKKAVDHLAMRPLADRPKISLLTVTEHGADAAGATAKAAQRLAEAGYETDTVFRKGAPDRVISEVASELAANMLIMGAFGHTRIRNMIIGSTTTTVMKACRIPLLLFR